MKYWRIVWFIVFMVTTAIHAQNTVELFSVSQQYSTPQQYDSIYLMQAQEKAFKADLTIPVVMSDTNIWYTNITYENFHVNSNNVMSSGIANPINVQGIALRTGLIHRFRNGRAAYLFLSPRMHGDFLHVSTKTFQVGGIVLIENVFRDDFIMRFGVAYYQDYVSPFFVPLVYIYRQFNDKLKIVGTLPQDLRIHYQLNDRFALGGQQFASSSIYHLSNRRYSDDYMQRKSINFSFYGRCKIAGPLCFELYGGYAYDREYFQYAGGDKLAVRFPVFDVGGNRHPKNVSFKDGLFMSFRLVVDYAIPK